MQISLSISFPEGILPEEENNSDTIISESSFTDTNITPDELDEIESLNREMDNLA
jgi:hypothetical protein